MPRIAPLEERTVATSRAVRTAPGDPVTGRWGTVIVTDTRVRRPGAREVTAAAGVIVVTPDDVALFTGAARSNHFTPRELPAAVGRARAGLVVEAAPGVGLQPGDAVATCIPDPGGPSSWPPDPGGASHFNALARHCVASGSLDLTRLACAGLYAGWLAMTRQRLVRRSVPNGDVLIIGDGFDVLGTVQATMLDNPRTIIVASNCEIVRRQALASGVHLAVEVAEATRIPGLIGRHPHLIFDVSSDPRLAYADAVMEWSRSRARRGPCVNVILRPTGYPWPERDARVAALNLAGLGVSPTWLPVDTSIDFLRAAVALMEDGKIDPGLMLGMPFRFEDTGRALVHAAKTPHTITCLEI